MIAQSSPSRFSIGVPVSASARRRGMRRSARCRFVRGFFASCASSRSSRSHSTAARVSTSRVATSYEVTTTSLRRAVSANAGPSSRFGPWWTCTSSAGAKRAISRAHCCVTLIGLTTSVGPTASPLSRSETSVAIACTVLPSPMSSARIPPTRRSPSSRSQPWPRSWNAEQLVAHPERRRERLEAPVVDAGEERVEAIVEPDLAELDTGLLGLEPRDARERARRSRARARAARGTGARARRRTPVRRAICLGAGSAAPSPLRARRAPPPSARRRRSPAASRRRRSRHASGARWTWTASRPRRG